MQAIDINRFKREHRDLDDTSDGELRELSLGFRCLALSLARDLATLVDRRGEFPSWRWLARRRTWWAMQRVRSDMLAAKATFEAVETLRRGSSIIAAR
jgi:hypothetical protein